MPKIPLCFFRAAVPAVTAMPLSCFRRCDLTSPFSCLSWMALPTANSCMQLAVTIFTAVTATLLGCNEMRDDGQALKSYPDCPAGPSTPINSVTITPSHLPLPSGKQGLGRPALWNRPLFLFVIRRTRLSLPAEMHISAEDNGPAGHNLMTDWGKSI
ncbi:hypothetical protein NDA11_003818 [Ustilago hordei]|uniref:Uncharacterized protein n=1 Tax=Ustilago hordei TaxID=120017 RepID=I2FMJ8_USTHO|nr:hypothetical protein NDA10_002823 [Ustilago hordei]KAJ1570778.1 hypothetical protein NDA11_003818 [Ustilago hordei]KAJ1587361.1 hypothetical protein NDA15_004864 [Ustilago hordei]KAJ1590034.1 hypothetical protein NDA12_003349 [Ustilago hordei]UTT96530.1 hypothetical protein NDA17_000037 [Ustilago hordei]